MNPELFRWARETSGLSIEQAASALLIKHVEKLQAIEAGAEVPSRPLLLRMAKHYRRPLVTFYLPAPPRKGDRGEDFRTLPPDRVVADDALLDALLRDVKARQAVVRFLVEEEEEREPLPFVGSLTMKDGAPAVLASIKDALRFDVAEYRAQKSTEDAFLYLRSKAEAAGIFVLLIGNLGTHHTAISVQSFRGFAVADSFAPFVIINDQDAKTAWSFTLMHELVHVWLGTTGISGTNNEKAIERFCNDVASRFLGRGQLVLRRLRRLQPAAAAPDAAGLGRSDRARRRLRRRLLHERRLPPRLREGMAGPSAGRTGGAAGRRCCMWCSGCSGCPRGTCSSRPGSRLRKAMAAT